MCFYITATLPNEAHIEDLKLLLVKFNMAFTPINNENVKSQLRSNELYFRPTKHYCDCNTILGLNNISNEYDKLLKSKKVKTMKKKIGQINKLIIGLRKKLNLKTHIQVKQKHLQKLKKKRIFGLILLEK